MRKSMLFFLMILFVAPLLGGCAPYWYGSAYYGYGGYNDPGYYGPYYGYPGYYGPYHGYYGPYHGYPGYRGYR